MNDITLPKICRLFEGVQEQELSHVITCLQGYQKNYRKQEIIYRRGEVVREIGIVLQGSVYVVKEDFWGNRAIIAEIGVGETFSEVYAAALKEPLEVEILAHQACTVLFLDLQHILQVCSKNCSYHSRILQNFMVILATKNLFLTRKMEHLSKRSTREKILSYLSSLSISTGQTKITVPFNRQGLADYLSVERSAMSRELSKMQKEGILRVHKNVFELLLPAEQLSI